MAAEEMRPIVPITIDIHKVAWLIITASFMLFCTASVTFSVGAYAYAFRSNVPMDMVVQVGQGTAVIVDEFQQRAPRTGLNFVTSLPTDVSIDSQSQATVAFRINRDEQQLTLATLTLQDDAALRISRAEQPRFTWSQGAHLLDAELTSGELDIFINPVAERAFRLQVHTLHGASILLETPGRYVLTVNENLVRLTTHEGVAAFLDRNRENNRLVTAGAAAILLAERPDPFVDQTAINLLDNASFSFALNNHSETTLPLFWQCSNAADDVPRGTYQADVWQSRVSLRFVRGDDADSHGETTCEQVLAEDKRDVAGFSHLELQTTFLINFQSLTECGAQGSECPLMLFIDYVDVSGQEREWYKGFYHSRDPQFGYPLRCASCAQPHTQINEQVWYTYSTGNLIALLPENERPQQINSVRFYASGHQYDVFVSEVLLLADRREIVPPSENLIPLNRDS